MEKLIPIVNLYLCWGLMYQDYELSFDFFMRDFDCRVACWVKCPDGHFDVSNFYSEDTNDLRSIFAHLDKLL